MPIVGNIYHAFTIVASVASQEAHPPSGTKPLSTGHEHAHQPTPPTSVRGLTATYDGTT